MAKSKKIYAVKKGKKTGIFTSWEECKEAVEGFSGCEYKGFNSEEEAKAYIDGEDIVLVNDILPRLQQNKVVAFTDGSYDTNENRYGSGVCIFAPDGINTELCNRGNNAQYIELRNIAGEIIAVLSAVDWAWKNGYQAISIFHDYEGIGKWATGEWKTNKNLSMYYKKYIDDKKDVIDIEFIKVDGHSNNIYNDRADKLAKSAIFENKRINDLNGNGGYIICPVSEESIDNLIVRLKTEYIGLDYTLEHNENNKKWVIKFNGSKLYINLFNNIKMVVQGKLSSLFQIVTNEVILNIHCGDFIRVLKSAYNIAIDGHRIEKELTAALPDIYDENLPNNISLLLKQAVINLSNPGNGDIEFTMYTFPALRALEGVLKFSLNKCRIPLINNNFKMFVKNNGVYELDTKSIGATVSRENIAKLENCYNFLYNNRHTLVHFGIIIGDVDVNTRLINTKKEANSIIKDTLKIINDNYIL